MTTSKDPTTDKLVDLQIAHLNLIQGVITRMSSFSAGVKNFCVTISVGIIAVAYQKQLPMLTCAAFAVVLIFCLMDTYYLSLEKRYRELYEQVAKRPIGQAYDMSLEARRIDFPTYFSSLRSISVAGFYVLLLIAVQVLLTIAHHAERRPAKTPPVSACSPSWPAAVCAKEPATVPVGAGVDGRASGAAHAELAQPADLVAAPESPNAGRSVRPH